MIRVLFIDNFDSFTFNLVDEFAKRECQILVYRNNTPREKINEVIREFKPSLIVISPGPGTPEKAGNCMKIIEEYAGKIPLFGVCLGMQAITEVFGGKVSKCSETIHGKASRLTHDNKTIFKNINQEFPAGRYHSLSAVEVPDCLEASAKTVKGIVMAVRHKEKFVEGVQFHPESVLTPEGGKIIENLLELVGGKEND